MILGHIPDICGHHQLAASAQDTVIVVSETHMRTIDQSSDHVKSALPPQIVTPVSICAAPLGES